MGLFDGRSHSDSDHLRANHSSHARSRSRGHSPARSTSGYFVRPSNPRSGSNYTSSSRGIFSGASNNGSYYRRRPRDNFISALMQKLQRMIKELWAYARRHPVKAFFAVVVPLLSAGGAVHGLLRQFGVRIPFVDGQAARMMGGYYGSRGYGRGGESGEGGWMQNAGSLMTLAKAFM
ncbi:Hypothetical protein R9X50_00647800 [Acrodontium crateriforme]|uniref:Uncharacterized protein n=1 Tax=Acrodontium crateriforme TaxID=150365 RepID=A0AAQ3MBM1_9PEZI|nr:Hypothetical protein R9X50_00647800 [Acrodontium crateriforme]